MKTKHKSNYLTERWRWINKAESFKGWEKGQIVLVPAKITGTVTHENGDTTYLGLELANGRTFRIRPYFVKRTKRKA